MPIKNAILVIEPDRTLAETISKHLNNSGFEVIVASNAQEGVSHADNKKPDLVILELAMSKNNGLAFLQEFRSYTDWINVPIIVYSRISQEETGLKTADWEKEGIVDYLYKPTKTLTNLLASINENL